MIRRTSVLLALALACPTAAWAATNSLHKGAWGLEFQVQSPLFSSSGAAGIGVIRHFSDRSAVRLGTIVGISSQDAEGSRTTEMKVPWDSMQVTAQQSGYSDTRDVTLFLHLAHYLGVGKRLAMRAEAGPSVRWFSYEQGRTDIQSRSDAPEQFTSIQISDGDSWSYGVDLQAGIEWFIRSRLSLAVRYGITAQRTEGKRTDRYEDYRSDGPSQVQSQNSRWDGYNVQTTPSIVSLIGYW